MNDERPRPVPDKRSQGFWDAAARGVVAVQRCANCLHYTHPPAAVCTQCFSAPAFEFVEVSGRGRIRSWTRIHRPFVGGFDQPPIVVDVELEEQPDLRMLALYRGRDEELSAGTKVLVAASTVDDGVAVPVAVPAGPAG